MRLTTVSAAATTGALLVARRMWVHHRARLIPSVSTQPRSPRRCDSELARARTTKKAIEAKKDATTVSADWNQLSMQFADFAYPVYLLQNVCGRQGDARRGPDMSGEAAAV